MNLKKLWKEWGNTVVAFFLITAAAFALRFINLVDQPIFADEAIYIRWAQVMRVEPTLRFLPLLDGKQPLFMWSIVPFLKFFNDPLFAGRFVSVLTGLGSLLGIFVATYLLFKSKKAALVASFIYAISPFSIFFDRMALVDSMLSMFGIWTFVGVVVTARTLRLDVAMITGFLLGFSLLTKSTALFYVLLLPLALLIVNLKKTKKKTVKITSLLKVVLLFASSVIIAYGMYNILRLGPNFQLLSQRNFDYVYPYSHVLTSPFDPFEPFIQRIFQYLIILGPGLLAVLLVLGVLSGFRKYRKQIIFVALWWLLPTLLVAEFSRTMTTRYVLFTFPYLVILASLGIMHVKENFRKIFVIGLILFIFQAVNSDRLILSNLESANLPRSERSGYLEEWTAGTGIKEIADYIKDVQKQNPDRKIVVGTEGYFGTLPDALQIYLNKDPKITVIGIGLELDHVSDRLINSRDAGNLTYLVANNERLFANPQDLGLKTLAAYPKAVRPDGSRQTLLLFEVGEDAVSPKSPK